VNKVLLEDIIMAFLFTGGDFDFCRRHF